MQQESGESEAPDHQQQSAPLRCPRCDSTDTKFRYFNNNDRAQPRHYCKTCRRYWTVGGSMRNIPFGGSRRNGNPAKECGPSSPYSSISVSPISSSDEWEHKLQHPLMGSQNILGTTKVEHLGSLSAPIPPASSYDLNDEISCLAAIQSLMQPHVVKERDFWSMALMNQPLPQHLPSYYGGNLGHPNCPMITPNLPQDFNNSFSFSAANASIWNNSNGNTNDRETARTSMNSNGWPHLPNYLGPP